MTDTSRKQKKEALFRLLAETTDPGDIAALLEDMCTPKEVENMAERLFTARLLLEGCTYNQVMSQADISSATLSRVSRCVQQGKGYSKLLKTESPQKPPPEGGGFPIFSDGSHTDLPRRSWLRKSERFPAGGPEADP